LASAVTGATKEEKRQKELAEIKTLVTSTSDPEELRSKLQQYKEVFSDFGRERQAAINFHLVWNVAR
jgi:hypothetical protein